MSGIIDKLKNVIKGESAELPEDRLVILITKPTGSGEAPDLVVQALDKALSSSDAPLQLNTCDKSVWSDDILTSDKQARQLSSSKETAAHMALVSKVEKVDGAEVLKSRLVISSHPPSTWRQPGTNKFKSFEMESLVMTDCPVDGIGPLAGFMRGLAWYEHGAHEAVARDLSPINNCEAGFLSGLSLCQLGVKNLNLGNELEGAFAKFNQALDTATEEQGDMAVVAFLNTASCLQHMARHAPEGGAQGLYDKAIGSYDNLAQMLAEEDPMGFMAPACMAMGAACLEKAMKLEDEEKREGLKAALQSYDKAITAAGLGTLNWALAQAGAGNVNREIGVIPKSGDEAIVNLRASVDSYRKALTILNPDETPWQYAETASGMATAQMEIGEVARGEEKMLNLLEAAQLFKSTTEIWTMESNPGDWATAMNNLGNNQYLIGSSLKPEKALEFINESIRSYEMALEVFTETHFQAFHQGVTMNMAKAKLLRSTVQKSLGMESEEGFVPSWDDDSTDNKEPLKDLENLS